MALLSRDTRDAAELVQIRAHRALTGAQRYMLAAEMSDSVRDIALAGLRARHPELSGEELMRLFVERFVTRRRPR